MGRLMLFARACYHEDRSPTIESDILTGLPRIMKYPAFGRIENCDMHRESFR
jgi:hypothetical protein